MFLIVVKKVNKFWHFVPVFIHPNYIKFVFLVVKISCTQIVKKVKLSGKFQNNEG